MDRQAEHLSARPGSGAPTEAHIARTGRRNPAGGRQRVALRRGQAGGGFRTARPVGVAPCRNLAAAVDSVIAVVRPGDSVMARCFRGERRARQRVSRGQATAWARAWRGAFAAAPVAAGWIIALADMPWIDPGDDRAGRDCVATGRRSWRRRVSRARAGIRWALSARFFGELAALSGDEGARHLLARARGIHSTRRRERRGHIARYRYAGGSDFRRAQNDVIAPAQAGAQVNRSGRRSRTNWIPACAGMTCRERYSHA